MNIEIPKLNESLLNVNDLTESDLFKWLDANFPDNPKNWKEATEEIVNMALWIYENLLEFNHTKADLIKDVSKSKTAKEWNLKHKKRIKIGFPLMKQHYQNMFFEQFGHWIVNWKLNQNFLNENQNQLNNSDDKEISDVLKLKVNQFTFDCGIFMGTISSGLNNKFGLLWHAENTTNLGFFLSSVEKFINISENKLTSQDIEKLTNHYVKYYFKD